MSIFRVESYVEIRLAAATLRKRNEQRCKNRGVLNVVAMFADDSDDLHVVRLAIFRRLRITNMLANRVFVRKEFLRHFFVDDGDPVRIFVLAFLLSEIAAAQ